MTDLDLDPKDSGGGEEEGEGHSSVEDTPEGEKENLEHVTSPPPLHVISEEGDRCASPNDVTGGDDVDEKVTEVQIAADLEETEDQRYIATPSTGILMK